MQQRELVDVVRQVIGQAHDRGEDHRGCAHDCRADEHRLGRGLKGVARAVVFLEVVLGLLELRFETVYPLDFRCGVGDGFNGGQLIHGLCVVGDRAIGVDRDGHRAHAQEAERDEAKREDRRGGHERDRKLIRNAVADGHQDQHDHAQPEALKLPATSPERMFSEAPPSSELVTISRTWRLWVEVKTLTNSGINAPASVPQLMMVESFHQ